MEDGNKIIERGNSLFPKLSRQNRFRFILINLHPDHPTINPALLHIKLISQVQGIGVSYHTTNASGPGALSKTMLCCSSDAETPIFDHLKVNV